MCKPLKVVAVSGSVRRLARTQELLKALPVLIVGGFISISGAVFDGLIIHASEKLAEVHQGPIIGGGI